MLKADSGVKMGQAASSVRKEIKDDQMEQKKQFDDTMESLRQMAEDKIDKFYEDIESVIILSTLLFEALTPALEEGSRTTSFCQCTISRANSPFSNAKCQKTAKA